jgi:iron complex transport system substrate-binding protein
VASLKLCTDELLLLLAAPEQVASLTYLSRERLESSLWRRARRYPGNDGSLLSVTTLRPDLVVDMGGGGRDSARIARRLGIRLLTLPYPQSIADIEAAVRRLSAALDRPQAGERLNRRIAELKRTAPRRQLDAVWRYTLAHPSLSAEHRRHRGSGPAAFCSA